jgi:exodeoxyribonuclease VII small subunit
MDESRLETLTFEEALSRLEGIVRELEDGKIGLEESLERYEHGVALLRRCFGQLQRAEQRIVELLGLDEEGRAQTRLFEHVARMESPRNEKDGGLAG